MCVIHLDVKGTVEDQELPLCQYVIFNELIVVYTNHIATEDCVIIGSVDGLLLDGTKPIHEPSSQCGPVTITWRQFHKIYIP